VGLAGYTIAMRLLMFALMPAWGLTNAAATLVGQNLGAGKADRAEKSVWITGCYTMVFLGSVTVVCLLFGDTIARWMADNDPAVAPIAASGLRIIGYGYIMYGWGMVTMQAFNGAGDTRTPFLVNLFCFWLVKLPLAYALTAHWNWHPTGVFVAVLVAYSCNALIGLAAFRSGRWKRLQSPAT
jgi:Na+-driven multidrug efflux pump